jgi:preprotein translocase subunit YajC
MEVFSGQAPFLLLILVVFFFFIILPQQRRQKKEKTFLNNIKKGNRIITKSGMHGKIAEVNEKDNTCVIETLAGKIKMERSGISVEMSSKLNPPPAKKK